MLFLKKNCPGGQLCPGLFSANSNSMWKQKNSYGKKTADPGKNLVNLILDETENGPFYLIPRRETKIFNNNK